MRDYDGTEKKNISQETFSSRFLGLASEGLVSYRKFNNLRKWEKQYVMQVQSELQGCEVHEPEDVISGIFEEVSYVDTMAKLESINITHERNEIVKVKYLEMYEFLSQVHEELEETMEVQVETKYKTVAKKVRHIAVSLPKESDKVKEMASQQPTL